ncbi:hypothetical protein OGAPHI_007139 [Ogataea philodendri]|uniref:Uncharacterized protein n=1 Tax=Ogataea philodendri TaxID=1378263 RepID=A0A9P8NVD2_9ASCO|nr:uncharacterized protein OGAPHI_007139 [Ogataea philodendri]KAH3660553.1 hypothetical protein OGAPHI_007139 [Ogataea philodendri]
MLPNRISGLGIRDTVGNGRKYGFMSSNSSAGWSVWFNSITNDINEFTVFCTRSNTWMSSRFTPALRNTLKLLVISVSSVFLRIRLVCWNPLTIANSSSSSANKSSNSRRCVSRDRLCGDRGKTRTVSLVVWSNCFKFEVMLVQTEAAETGSSRLLPDESSSTAFDPVRVFRSALRDFDRPNIAN